MFYFPFFGFMDSIAQVKVTSNFKKGFKSKYSTTPGCYVAMANNNNQDGEYQINVTTATDDRNPSPGSKLMTLDESELKKKLLRTPV